MTPQLPGFEVDPAGSATMGTAFVLHQRELAPGRYRYDLLWENGLRAAVLARDSSLQPFRRYACRTQAVHAAEHLPTLLEARESAIHEPSGNALIAGLYLNEILVRCLPGQAWLEHLGDRYGFLLQGLADPRGLPWCLRLAEYALFRELGLGLDAVVPSHDMDCADAEQSEPSLRFVLGTGWCDGGEPSTSPAALRRSWLRLWQALADAFDRRWPAARVPASEVRARDPGMSDGSLRISGRGALAGPDGACGVAWGHQPSVADGAANYTDVEAVARHDETALRSWFVDLCCVAEAENPGFARAVRDLHRSVVDQFLDGQPPLRSRALWPQGRHAAHDESHP